MTIIFHKLILEKIPRILSLLDKNPFSSTYGSFDRKFWHYKILDFPCGMQQELVVPLAYVWKTEFPNNKYYGLPRIRDYLEGILNYHVRCSHSDGSLDDYFPHERAYGATAYALAALTEASMLTAIRPEQAVRSFEQSGTFLTHYRETGCLSNHLAISALALHNLFLLTNTITWQDASSRIVKELRKLQHEEGWFPEYEGCDLGYQTVTVEFLARLYQKTGDTDVLAMLKRNVHFLLNFIHPDGSLGGEYGSRNTYNFYPGGFAVLSREIPEAATILGSFIRGEQNGSALCLDDDGVFGHLLSSCVTVLCCKEPVIQDRSKESRPDGLRFFQGAGFFHGKCGNLELFGSTTKGGVYKVFKDNVLLNSDTGFVGTTADGVIFCQNKPGSSAGTIDGNEVVISGELHAYKQKRLSRVQMIALRIFSLLLGEWWKGYSNFIRALMQKLLILDRKRVAIKFMRRIQLDSRNILVRDEIHPERGVQITGLQRSTDCVDLHVITSDAFQSANLLPWEQCEIDNASPPFKFEKRYG